jgi:hypothetical protein
MNVQISCGDLFYWKGKAMARKKRGSSRSSDIKHKRLNIGIISIIGIALFALLGYAIWAAFQPEPVLGEQVPIVGSAHIPEGDKASDYITDPPTSGEHYASEAEAGFYDEAPADEQLVHNLEHGYIVVYYDCEGLSSSACSGMKDDLRGAIGAAGVSEYTRTSKIIVVPRLTMENMITYTSWGWIYYADDFDREEFVLFVKQNRDNAPEPFAP